MLKRHVVIVGGGWAGITLVRNLKALASHKIRITLISNEPNFRYSAALYRVATGHKENEALIPIPGLIESIPNVEFVRATVTDLDQKDHTVTIHGGEKFHYDYVVLALGSVTNYFGIPGIEEKSYGIKTQKEVRKFRTHLHKELLDDNKPDKNYVIIGAGPTGVELAAAMGSYMKAVLRRHGIRTRRINIDLVEAAPRVLPMSDPKASAKAHDRLVSLGVKVKTNSKVEHETDDSLIVNGKSIPTHTVTWTAGVANNPFFKRHSKLFMLNNRGKVIVDDHLRSEKRTYVIGDNAATQYSGLALTAVHNAHYVAKDLEQRINGESTTPAYKPQAPATVVPVGSNWGVFQYKKIVIGGHVGGVIRSLADYIAYKDIAGYKKAYSLWRHVDDEEEHCVLCKTKLIEEQTY